MALLIYYNQIRNDPNEVEYQFGDLRDALDRNLIIDKTNESVRTDQPEDGIFRAVCARIMIRAHTAQVWPQNGVIAS
ncbi:hypothetical protein ACIA8C_32820 [Nocardia sp. NPDC051321]|uniref:hypothetical protein n=1 Tax=Nocardia sp. NPDC051321 TaxID=3364323 RepID=UPI0037989BA5